MDCIQVLREQFNGFVELREKRPGIMSLIAPLYHEDGDMLDIFLECPDSDSELIRICDHGMTLMRLSYAYELDTPNKQRILERIITENRVRNENGNLIIDTSLPHLYSSVMQFAQTVAKISSMKAFKREALASLFEEMIDEIVTTRLIQYNPSAKSYPLPEHPEYEVDYVFPLERYPVYLFEVNNVARAHLAIISCQQFLIEGLSFKSFMVHQDFNALPAKDRLRITNIADKQFTSVDRFREDADRVFALEAVA